MRVNPVVSASAAEHRWGPMNSMLGKKVPKEAGHTVRQGLSRGTQPATNGVRCEHVIVACLHGSPFAAYYGLLATCNDRWSVIVTGVHRPLAEHFRPPRRCRWQSTTMSPFSVPGPDHHPPRVLSARVLPPPHAAEPVTDSLQSVGGFRVR